MDGDLLVQLRERSGADLRSSQRFNDVLGPVYPYTSQMHLQHRPLDRGDKAPVTLYNGLLENILARPRKLELNFTSIAAKLDPYRTQRRNPIDADLVRSLPYPTSHRPLHLASRSAPLDVSQYDLPMDP